MRRRRCGRSLIVIEDARELWSADLFAALAANGYTVSSRSKLNVMLRRTGDQSSERHRVGDRETLHRHRAAIGDRLDAARLARGRTPAP